MKGHTSTETGGRSRMREYYSCTKYGNMTETPLGVGESMTLKSHNSELHVSEVVGKYIKSIGSEMFDNVFRDV